MAVIQDMPAEIFRRILELGADDSRCFERRDLCSAALVARAWTQPSQELLVYDWWCPTYRFADYRNAPEYDTSPPPTRRLRSLPVGSLKSAAKARRLIGRHGTLLHCLDVYDMFSASDLLFFLLNGVRDLNLCAYIHGDLAFPNGTILALKSLSLDSSNPPSFTLLQDFVANAPHLTRLELWYPEAIPSVYEAPLLALASRLRHITLMLPEPDADAGHLSLYTLLRACTSLASLDLQGLHPGDLPKLLSSLHSRPLLLVCSFNKDTNTDESVASDFLGALQQHALANLMRWRWDYRLREVYRVFIPYATETVDSWEAACRSRGIEPRGRERYYTD